MLIVRRWWTRYGISIVLGGMVLGGAWFVHQTQGAAILEIYYWVTRPLQSESSEALQARLTNARIVELQQQVGELERQNQQLQKLLGYFEPLSQTAIAAPVIGRSPDNWWKQVILGRGHQDGIKVGYVVTGIGGVVGQVIEVTPHTSLVLLVSDPSSRIGVMISRSRSMGIIQGQGGQIAVMRFFEKVPAVRPGDTVTISTVSRLFPPGLPLGRVKSVNLSKGPAPEAKIELTAPINHLEWVVVQPFTSKL